MEELLVTMVEVEEEDTVGVGLEDEPESVELESSVILAASASTEDETVEMIEELAATEETKLETVPVGTSEAEEAETMLVTSAETEEETELMTEEVAVAATEETELETGGVDVALSAVTLLLPAVEVTAEGVGMLSMEAGEVCNLIYFVNARLPQRYQRRKRLPPQPDNSPEKQRLSLQKPSSMSQIQSACQSTKESRLLREQAAGSALIDDSRKKSISLNSPGAKPRGPPKSLPSSVGMPSGASDVPEGTRAARSK